MKRRMKLLIDLLMTGALLLLMAYQVTGEKTHEWIGVGMLVLFLLHNYLNIRWYGCLIKGKYTPLRIFWTAVNLFTLITILSLGYSGVILSRYVFSQLPIRSGLATARIMHLAGSYWALVWMSIHMGLHWSMVTGKLGKLPRNGKWLVRAIAAAIALYGGVCFYLSDIASYLFLKVEFAFLDYEKSSLLILAEYFAMMGFWVFLSYYGAKALHRLPAAGRSKRTKKRNDLV